MEKVVKNKRISLKVIALIAFSILGLLILRINANTTANFVAGNFLGGPEVGGFFASTTARTQLFAERGGLYDQVAYSSYLTGELQGASSNINVKRITKDGNLTNPIYCFEQSFEFPTTKISYTSLGELQNVNSIRTKAGTKTLDQATKNKLYYLFSKMYYREESEVARKEAKLALIEEIVNNYHASAPEDQKETQRRAYAMYVTDDAFSLINQWLIWGLLNNVPDTTDKFLVDVTKKINGSTENRINGDQETYIKNAYKYLKAQSNANSNYQRPVQIGDDVQWLAQNMTKAIYENNAGFEVNNIQFIESAQARSQIKNVRFYYKMQDNTRGTEIPRARLAVYKTNAPTVEVRDTFLQLAQSGESFNIKSNTALPAGATGIIIVPEFDSLTLSATLWEPTDATNKTRFQTLVEVAREKLSKVTQINIDILPRPKKADFALRKYITAVNGVNLTDPRSPQANFENFSNGTLTVGNGTLTTLDYRHEKDPVGVYVGDTVKYTILVTNEGEVAGKVTKIADKIPDHLELKANSEINTKYGWQMTANNVAETTYTANTNLNPLTQVRGLSLTAVEIELVVKNTAVVGRVETNIASILDVTTEGNIADRDSTPNNVRYPTDLPNYKGNTSNKTDLTDDNYHYKGQEDDDDFEKVVILERQRADLALRKSIVSINNTNVAVSRIPNADTTILDNGSTTANYKHPKNPLTVKKGNTIKYQMTIYNEGNVWGIAKKIHDKLPDYLELKENSAINTKYGWTKLVNNVIETSYLQGTRINPLGTNKQLSSQFVEVELVVKSVGNPQNELQTNIASIAEAEFDGGLTDRDSQPNNVNYPTDLPNYKGNDSNKTDLTDPNYYYKGQQDDDDFEKVRIEPDKVADLALRKSIISINNTNVAISRIPNADTTILNNGSTTANYKHPKNPLTVKKGDTIKYQMTIYNEGEVWGIAKKIHDKLPDYLELKENSAINTKYGWTKLANNVIETSYLQGARINALGANKELSNNFVEVELVVKRVGNPQNELQTNIASIAEAEFEDNLTDRDSQPNNVNYPTDLPNYKGNSNNKNELNDKDYHYKGQQDDDDFEKVRIEPDKVFDLALRKFITKINDKNTEVSREPIVDVTPLKTGSTTAKYTHPKNALSVDKEDIVVYTLRVYNEAEVVGIASKITDYLPNGVEFLPEHEVNKKYGWFNDGVVNENGVKKFTKIATNYLDPKMTEAELNNMLLTNQIPTGKEDKVLRAFNKETGNTLDYKDLQIAVKVVADVEEKDNLKNLAEISEDYPGNDPNDRDSDPNNIRTTNYGTTNQEDDDDFEPLKLNKKAFDLSLRKFITKISSHDNKRSEDYTKSRTPIVDITPLKNGETTAKYTHPKNPLTVTITDRVEYTIRIYNEGEIDGYAEKIMDNIPEYLEFLSEDEVNKQYGWKKVDEDKIETNYLSRDESLKRKEDSKLLKFDGSKLDYKDVKVAFRVKNEYKEEHGIIKNIAEITKDFNEFGVPDRDSIPNNVDLEGYGDTNQEDDDDFDNIQPRIFDLALRKIVSKIIVTTNGKEKVIETKHKFEDDPENVAKYEFKKEEVEKSEVKWEYQIRVKNEGTVDGYVREITDYIPEGTYFEAKDNPEWKLVEANKATTDQLKDTLLKPGESKVVTIYLRWKKDAKNLGVKTNWAEISKDFNEFNLPDKDSVPGNRKPKEDDIDEAPVALAIVTGLAITYTYHALFGTTLLAGILAGYKKYRTNLYVKNKKFKNY